MPDTLPLREDPSSGDHNASEVDAVSGVTIYGLCAVSFMMGMYALERRGRVFIFGFALGCLLSSAYGFLSGAWPFGIVEIVWSGVALARLRQGPADPAAGPSAPHDRARGPSVPGDPPTIDGS